ncbi:hypothetical protein [Cryobacterium sp. MLB-32]|uniref:hypothetical protein n=1 Tax=Cryobacterium sp. MLB-32 TaxID=1529318 RepID=UPI0012E01D91|nr:hypothetical protein [Cryobacterium sp. MLB-32]
MPTATLTGLADGIRQWGGESEPAADAASGRDTRESTLLRNVTCAHAWRIRNSVEA